MKFKNEDLLRYVAESKKAGEPTPELFEFFVIITEKWLIKKGYQQLTYRGDLVFETILFLNKYWNNFDSSKSQNPFAYYLQMINQCVLTKMHHIKKAKGSYPT